MIDTFVKLVSAKAVEHWEGIATLVVIVLYGRNDYRVTKLEREEAKRTTADCDRLMHSCGLLNNERHNEGRRELDGIVNALNRLGDAVRVDIKTTNDKLDKLIDYMIEAKK